MHTFDPARFVRRAGPAVAVRALADQVASRRVSFGLRCDLSNLPAAVPGKVPIHMSARAARGYTGFDRELAETSGTDYLEVLLRNWMYAREVKSLYAADAADGRPIFAQWLIRPIDDWRLRNKPPHDVPVDGEVLLEGAYTFVAFRGVGAMADGMGQVLRVARDGGNVAAITYVLADNVPSLRGCARVGFVLDHVRLNTTQLGRERSERRPVDARARQIWESALAPKATSARPPG